MKKKTRKEGKLKVFLNFSANKTKRFILQDYINQALNYVLRQYQASIKRLCIAPQGIPKALIELVDYKMSSEC